MIEKRHRAVIFAVGVLIILNKYYYKFSIKTFIKHHSYLIFNLKW